MSHSTGHFCSIVPPYILQKLAKSDNEAVRNRAIATMQGMARVRSARTALSATISVPSLAAAVQVRKARRIFDCENSSDFTRRLVLQEGGRIPHDVAVAEAYNYSGLTWDFFHDRFGRNSIDDRAMTIVSSVHYSENGQGFDNAFWDGRQMVYGDGGEIFHRMTKCIDVVAHELTHGITQYSAGLPYENQSGALNEHFSDVFGVVIRQHHEQQRDPNTANWLIGDGLMISGDALRSMSAPGTAFPDDPQPAHMDEYQDLPNNPFGDWGGVHINSGIPNHVFYRAACSIGDPSWETAAHIWYLTLVQRLRGTTSFEKCAYETISVARDFYNDAIADKVAQAWIDVGVLKAAIGPLASLPISKRRTWGRKAAGAAGGTGKAKAQRASAKRR